MTNELVPIKGKPELAIAVPNGTKSGDVVPVGPDGLMVVTKTPQITQEMANVGRVPQGLEVGQASCNLLGCCGVLTLAITGAVAVNAAIYRAGDGTYTATAQGNVKIGYALTALAAAGVTDVAIIG